MNNGRTRGESRKNSSPKKKQGPSPASGKKYKTSGKFDKGKEDKLKHSHSKKYTKFPSKTPKIKEPSSEVRLNKFIANSGVCSRREADRLIETGLVEVNGKVVTEMGYKVLPTDEVKFDGRRLSAEKPVYVLLNKPKGFISTTKDEKARKTVMDLVTNASPYRLFPVGRLDRTTTGVILLTNDGELTKKLLHPSYNIKKIYQVELDKPFAIEDLQTLRDEGVRLDEGLARVDAISYIAGEPKNKVGVELHIGWNRVVRRIFKKLGYNVEKLDRVQFAGLTKKNLPRGNWRILTEMEVNNLKML